MTRSCTLAPTLRLAVLAAFVTPLGVVKADVTVTQETTVDVRLTKLHTTSTERTTSDKQRRDSESKADGMIGGLIGTLHGADIVRLDRDLEWHLEPDKKRYRESSFLTPEQRAQMQQKLQAAITKLKSCPAGPQHADADPTCEKSTPTFNVARTGDTATIAGHPTHKSVLTMTYTCKNPKTGDTCDFVATNELWTSDDAVPGFDDRQAFARRYQQKMGFDPSSAMAGQMRAALAPYLDQIKELGEKAAEIKGTPLRTVFSLSIGGAQCAAARAPAAGTGDGTVGDGANAAKQAAAQSTASAADSAAQQAVSHATSDSVAGKVLGSAANAFNSKLIGGLFAKKPGPAATPAAGAAGSAPAASEAPRSSLLSLTTEVTSISTDPVAASQFELPAGWQKIEPKPGKDPDDVECPKTGN